MSQSVETIYRAFGSKAAPFKAVVEAAADLELVEVRTQLETRRLDGMRRIAQLLSRRGASPSTPAAVPLRVAGLGQRSGRGGS